MKGLQQMDKKQNLKSSKIHKSMLGMLVIAVIGIILAGGIVFAKYTADNSSKGVAAAANYYFTSDLLGEADEENSWKTIYNSDTWDGLSQYPFGLKIQNYQNQLLYNGENLDVTYNITFTLLEDDGGSYAVQYGTEGFKNLKVNTPVTYETMVIKGGVARADEFNVLFFAPRSAQEEYRSAGVQVVAEVVAPDYLAAAQKQIGGILYAGIVRSEYFLEGKYDFTVSGIDNTWTEEDKAVIDAMAAFPYTISYSPGEDNAAHQIKIVWNAEKLQLNKFDERIDEVEAEEGSGKSFLKIYIQPHETLQLIFYRTNEFDLEQLTPSEFQSLIEITDLNQIQ